MRVGDPNAPLDPLHAECLEARRWVRDEFAKLRESVSSYSPPPASSARQSSSGREGSNGEAGSVVSGRVVIGEIRGDGPRRFVDDPGLLPRRSWWR